MASEHDRVSVRATINLPSLPVGATAIVDPTVPYIAACLEAGYLTLDED